MTVQNLIHRGISGSKICLPLKVFGMQRGKFRELEISCNTSLDIQTSHYCRWFPGSIKKQEGARAISEQS